MVVARNLLRSLAAAVSSHGARSREVMLALKAAAAGQYPWPQHSEDKLRNTARALGIDGDQWPVARLAQEVAGVLLEDLSRTEPATHRTIQALAPAERLETWRRLGILPISAYHEVFEALHRTTTGTDGDWENLMAPNPGRIQETLAIDLPRPRQRTGAAFEGYRRRVFQAFALVHERMKFGALFEAARRHGADRLATGHYAGLKRDTQGRAALVRGLDDTRDQSYFLSLVPIEVLGQACFPLAGQRKTDVRQRLAQLGFAPPLPCESRDICFVSDNDYKQFLLERGVALPGEGPILLENGHEIGRHQGLWRHTIGQRRGLRIPYREPLYVVAKDVARNTLVVGPQEALAVSGCRVTAGNTLVSAREWPRELVIQTCYRMESLALTIFSKYRPTILPYLLTSWPSL